MEFTKKSYFVPLLLALLLTACNQEQNIKRELGTIYSNAFDSIMLKDEALNSEMQFITLDLTIAKKLSENDKKEIKRFLKDKYGVDVIEATFKELKDKGLYNPKTMVLHGVLLKLEKAEFISNNKAFEFEGSKYRAGNGAVGVKGKLLFKDGSLLKSKRCGLVSHLLSITETFQPLKT
ncbi:peptide ABC transporter substrate-binding protein [Fictibacillus sp. b24]|uniref:peptide ABC transporter substrate-binding protein n=1 Tax=Fictibacillus sp. b24 TaxID=3055863 RepID=UPI0025A10F8C|nr:peptide ABC transporter substrate-binding protein [Fictibacillus sp. b24]MDM5317252.1 peptide ABC transporter substrate-binding protein [Fictibacillus sp. b24]